MSIRGARYGRGIDKRKLRKALVAEIRRPNAERIIKARFVRLRPAVTVKVLKRRAGTFVSVDRGSKIVRLFKRLRVVRSYRVAVGAAGYETPRGMHRVQSKQRNPAWHAPNRPWAGELAGQTIPAGDPRNPLKAAFIALGGGVGFHGTANLALDRHRRVARLHPHARAGRAVALPQRAGRHARARPLIGRLTAPPPVPFSTVARKKDDDAIPTGRIRRTAKVGGLAAGQTARNYATKAANLTRDAEGRRAAAEKRQIEAAEQIVDVLGQMKGAAMKVGQVASFMDTGALPPEVQERFQEKLAALRDSAPKVSFDDMRRSSRPTSRSRSRTSFAEFEQEPLAAASIGQVYRATPARRPPRRGQGAVPARRRRRPRRHAEPRADPARRQDDGAGHRLQGDGRRDPRAHLRGARLRARGAGAAPDGAAVARPPVRRHPRRRDRACRASACS